MKDLTPEDRPREKLLRNGPTALGDNELVALVLGSGFRGTGALQLANELLRARGGVHGLVRSTAADLARTAPARAAARAPQEGPSVLIVDDNEDAAAMLAEYVASLGYRVRTAHDGPAALKAVVEASPDMALLDIGLPVMDGYELASRLRQAPAPPKLIAVTGYGQAADRERTRQSGFDAHLVKPVDLDALADLLERLRGDSVS